MKTNRPWQNDLVINPETCPFEFPKKENEEIARYPEIGWRVLKNIYTPFPWHALIAPFKCCESPEEMRMLGGTEQIKNALRIGMSIKEVFNPAAEMWLGAHVGALGGQNVMHIHWHLLEPFPKQHGRGQSIYTIRNNPLLITENERWKAVAGGHRAGQCFFFAKNTGSSIMECSHLGELVSEVIQQYDRKFESKSGIGPDYMVGFRIKGMKIEYGYYLPILNHWGFTEYFALLEGTPLILPWPHEKTVEHLKT